MTKVKRVIIVPTAPELSFSPVIRAVDYIDHGRRMTADEKLVVEEGRQLGEAISEVCRRQTEGGQQKP